MNIEKVIKQTKFKDSYHKAYINLLYTANYFRDVYSPIFTAHGLQSQHYNILRIVKGKHPCPVSPGYIKEVMIDKGRDLTRLIDKLVNIGLVTRYSCPDNKRKMNIILTDRGEQVLEEMSTELNQIDQNIRTLSEPEYEKLSELLDKMRG